MTSDKDKMDSKDPMRVGDRVYRHVLDERLTESDLEKASKELNETPEKRKEALQQLRDMLAKEEDLNPCTDDAFLLRFLRFRKFNLEEAVKSVKNFYNFRLKYPKLFVSPSQLERVMKDQLTSILPYRDVEGRTIFIHKLGSWNPEEVSFYDYFCCMLLMVEGFLNNPVTQINGIVAICDFQGFSFAQFKELIKIGNVMMCMGMLQSYFPGRNKLMPVVNSSRLFQLVYRIVSPFMKEKFQKRILILTEEELHRHLDPSILPEKYGGTLPNYDFEALVQQALNRENFFQRDRSFGYKS